MQHIKNIIFDLDGTLLDTLDDLTAAVNHALRTFALPERSREEVRAFVGNGVRKLVERAVPQETDERLFEEIFASFRAYYVRHSLDRTQPYPGILPMLTRLKREGCRMAIVSNKLQPAVTTLNDCFFSDFMLAAVGESETVKRKPAPDGVLEALRLMGGAPSETLYVGDSEVDIATARNAGVACASVLWGFRDEPLLRASGATILLRAPHELFTLLGLR